MKKTTIRQLYFFTLTCNIFTLLCGVTGDVVLPIFTKDFIEMIGKVLGIVCVVCIVLAFTALIIFSLISLIKLLKDYRAVKHNDFVTIVGKVIRFAKNKNTDSGAQINDKPVVMITDTNEEIVLNVNDKITVGESYRFNYLKHCKIAEIVEKL